MSDSADPMAMVGQAVASRVRWTQVAPTLMVVWIVSMFDKSNIAIVMANPDFLREFSLAGHSVQLGWLASGLFIAYAVFAPFWGWLIGRIGARRTLAASLLVWVVTCFASGAAASYGMLLASRAALGAGEAALFPVTLALVANWFALKERGRATAYWWIGTMIGPMLTGLIVTALIVTLGWRAQFYAMGFIALLVPLPMVWFLVRDRPDQHPAVNRDEARLIEAGALERDQGAPGRILRAGGSVWRNHRYWLVVLAISCNNIFIWGWTIWLPSYLRLSRGLSFSVSGYLTFVIYGCATLTILTAGILSDRVFRRAPLAGAGWAVGGVLLIGAALVPSALASIVLMILALCAQQIGVSCGEMLMHSVVGAGEMGSTQGVRAFVSQLTGALAPAMLGYLLAATGNFTMGFVVLALALIVSAGCMAVLSREGL
jgi:sugar phosphate permease